MLVKYHLSRKIEQCLTLNAIIIGCRGRGRDRMIVRFIITFTISAYHHLSCEFEFYSCRGVVDTFCDKVCQWLATGRWFSPDILVSSTNSADCHDITEILLKMALNTITLTLTVIYLNNIMFFFF